MVAVVLCSESLDSVRSMITDPRIPEHQIVDYASALINGIDLCTSTYISHVIRQSCNMSVTSQPLG